MAKQIPLTSEQFWLQHAVAGGMKRSEFTCETDFTSGVGEVVPMTLNLRDPISGINRDSSIIIKNIECGFFFPQCIPIFEQVTFTIYINDEAIDYPQTFVNNNQVKKSENYNAKFNNPLLTEISVTMFGRFVNPANIISGVKHKFYVMIETYLYRKSLSDDIE